MEKPVIGLCGGVGAGKSAVAAAFARHGCVVIDSDALNRAVLAEKSVIQQLVGWWGPAVLAPEGTINRRAVAEIVFQDAAARERLESLTHPLIAARRAAIISKCRNDAAVKAIILDSPLLFESNLDRMCTAVVFVSTDAATRLKRLQENRGWGPEELMRRERAQLPLDEKRSRSHFTIENGGSIAELDTQVRQLLSRLQA